MIRDPVIGSYRGHRIYTFPPPSSGGVALVEALNVLEGFELAPLGAGSSASVHRIAEALKLSFADTLAFVGDPDFVSVPAARLDREALRREAARAHRSRPPRGGSARRGAGSRASSRSASTGPGLPARDAGTTHLSTSDAAGNAVALTMTINTPYGSGITAGRTGILLNNEMDDFAIAPDMPNTYGLVDTRGANAIAPRKRPRSSMTPTIVEKDGRLFMVTGSPGGPRIISTTLLSIVNVIDYGMDASRGGVGAALPPPVGARRALPRARDRRATSSTRCASAATRWSWRSATGRPPRRSWSSPSGAFWGGSDPRRDGLAAGY